MADDKDREVAAAIYQAYLEDLGRIGSRHETLRAFYVSLISALFVFLSLGGADGALIELRRQAQILIALIGALISVSWFLHMWSLAVLFSAKLHTLCEIEEKLPLQPFSLERKYLSRVRRVRITVADRVIALIFAILFFSLLLLSV